MVRKYTDPRSGKNYNFKDEDLTIQQMQEKIDAYEKTQAPQQTETQQPPKPSFDKMYQDPDTENSTNDEFLKNDPDFIDASKPRSTCVDNRRWGETIHLSAENRRVIVSQERSCSRTA